MSFMNQNYQQYNLQQDPKSFPTAGLKSILTDSDLLDILMKPIQTGEYEKVKDVSQNEDKNLSEDLSSLDFDDLLKTKSEQAIDIEYDALKLNMNERPKSYGNAFLGPNLWDKRDIFQDNKFVIENLGVDDFLNENNLNEDDFKFLDNLQNKNIKIDEWCSSPERSECSSSGFSNSKSESRADDFENIPTEKYAEERIILQPTMKKSRKQFVPNELKDDKYWSRRKKNNVAAKRSRDTRRFKENQIVITATYLEHENTQLRQQLEECKAKMAQMQALLNRYE